MAELDLNKPFSELIREGEKYEKDRARYHASYEEALGKQQAVRDFLRKSAKRELGGLKGRTRNDFPFPKHPEIEAKYGAARDQGDWRMSGWAVKWEGKWITGRYTNQQQATVIAYLLLQGLSPEEAVRGSEI